MTVTELAVSDLHRITYHENNPNSDKLLICFSPQGGGMGSSGFGTELCAKNGWNHIYVGKAQQSKFRSLQIDEFVAAVSSVADGRDAIAYGSSAGGYGALYYGGAINARILAACPRNSHHPINYRRRMIKRLGEDTIKEKVGDFYHTPDLRDLPRSSHNPTVVYDQRQPKDYRMVQKWVLPAYPACGIINVPNSGHRPLEKLKKVGGISHLVRSFVECMPIDQEKLKHLPGTVERRLDDAVVAFGKGDFDNCAELLNIDLGRLNRSRLLGIYIESVARSERAEHRASFISRRVEFLSLKRHIKPKTWHVVDKILTSA